MQRSEDPPSAPEDGPAPMLRGMARRRQLRRDAAGEAPPKLHQVRLPRPPAGLLLRRNLRMGVALLRVMPLLIEDRLQGGDDRWSRAQRLHALLQRLGGNAPRLAEELCQRIDLIPYEVYHLLAMVRDQAPPMPMDEALDLMRAAAGGPLEDHYAQIDPDPIISDSISCTWQAELHGGRRVAVKVLRPGIRETFAADVAALGGLLALMEWLTLTRPGFAARLEEELRQMIAEDLDLTVMARFQRLFRRYARKSGIDWVSAPRVFDSLGSVDVMVTELVSGVWLDEVISAVERQDAQALDRLRELGIEPRLLGRRLLQGAWWSFFETPFFQGAPRPRSVVVEPGNKLVFVSLRDCGGIATRKRQLVGEAYERLARRDVSGAAEAIIQLLSPLPFIDVDELAKALEARLWNQLFAIEDKRSSWVDRTSMGVWLAVLEVAWQHRVPMRMEVVRALRSFVLFDGMAGRLHPGLDLFTELRRYQLHADRRAARTLRRQVEGTSVEGLQAQLLARARDTAQLVDRLRFFMAALTERVPVQFFSLTGKAAYVAATLINLSLFLGALGLGLFLAMRVYEGVTGVELHAAGLRELIAAHPAPFNVVLAVALLLTIRRILFRMNDREQGD